MAANMKAVKLRIKSVESTMQITKAMELVASSKLRKAKERADTCRPYFRSCTALCRILQRKHGILFHLCKEAKTRNAATCWLPETAALRADTTRICSDALRQMPKEKRSVWFRSAKGSGVCKSRKLDILTDSFAEIANLSVADSFEIARALCREFRKGTFGHVELCYTKFVSMLSQMPVSVPILPLIDIAKEDGEDPEAKKSGI